MKPYAVCSLFLVILCFTWSGPARGITCKECREIEKRKAAIQLELSNKDKDMRKAFDDRRYKEVSKIRAEILDLKKELLDLRKEDDSCREACRPDVIKEAECDDIRSEILKLEESADSSENQAKADQLYHDLARCNEDLKRLKKNH